jgi:hypothetical protein
LIADPRAVAASWGDPRIRTLARIAVVVAEEPWQLGGALAGADHALGDDELAHAVMLAAYFGHLNRIADVVGVPLDYSVRHDPPHADPSVPALAPAPRATAIDPVPLLTRRASTAQAIAAWHDYVFERDAPLARADRRRIAVHVARMLGHALDDSAGDPALLDRTHSVGARDAALLALARVVTLAPWQLDDSRYQPLRALGLDDTAVFDACVVASTAGVVSRIAVALASVPAA